MKMKLSKSILAVVIATTMILPLSVYANTPIEVPERKTFEYPVTPKMNEWAELNTYKDKVDALQIPADILKTLSTEELLNIVLEYPLFYDIYAFDNYKEGLIFLSKNFNGIEELLNRQDFDEVLFDLYTEEERTTFAKLDDLDLENSIKSDENGILFFSDEVMNEIDSVSDLSKLEIFLSYEPIFQELSNDNKVEFVQNIDENLRMVNSKDSLFKYHLIQLNSMLNDDDDDRNVNAYTTTVRTPRGTQVTAMVRGELLSNQDIAYTNSVYKNRYPRATLLGNSTTNYNCHSYAWYSSSTYNRYWINNPTAYTRDGSYRLVGSIPSNTKYAFSNDLTYHSANVYSSPYYTGFIGPIYGPDIKMKSKWGAAPLMQHSLNDCPYYVYNGTSWK